VANKLRIHPLVVGDIVTATRWYDDMSDELGNRFRSALAQAIKDIRLSPERFSLAFDDSDLHYRRVRKFPYLVLYVPRADAIHIRGVVHASSDPEGWRARISAI
jgi:GT2 family glycosyltransferase